MLVLSRRLGEKIFIGKDIVITIVDLDKGKVRLGVHAPRSVAVEREEITAPNDPRRKLVTLDR